MSSKWWAVLAASGVLAVGVAACGDDSSDDSSTGSSGGASVSGELAGAGASSQEAAQEAWIAGFQDANPDATISYDPVGSGGGREQFIAGGVAYAGSDSPFSDDEGELTKATDRCKPGDLVQIPAYVSPIAVVYNLSGVDTLNLSPETIAGIFTQEITKWNDPAIAKDNPDVELPDTDITPVNRSDESGTTANFTDYLSATAPDVWTYEPDGVWPVKGGEAANGTSGVIEAVTAGDGAIGYADESQAGDLGIANVKVGNEFVAPSAEGAAALLEASPEDKEAESGPYVFAFSLDRTTTDPSQYPVTLVSYEIGCTQYDDAAQAALVKGYFDYVISADGQTAAADNAGSAPITDQLRKEIQPAVDAIQAG